MPDDELRRSRFTIADGMGLVAVLAVGFAWPVLLVPGIMFGLGPLLGRKRRRWGISLTAVASCLYTPFCWLLWVDSWSDYQLHWLDLWPILPGFVPGALLFHPHDVPEFAMMGVTTLVLLVGLTWLGMRGGGWLALACGIALVVASPQSYMAYGVYRF